MRLKLSKGKFLVGILSFILAFFVCTPAVFAEKDLDWQLRYAAIEGDLEGVKRLVAAGANVNAKDEYGRTPLHEAAERDHIKVVTYLVEHEADVNRKDKNGKTPLLCAGLKTLSFLLANGANAESKNVGLWRYARISRADVVQLFIDNGADVNCEDKYGETPLMFVFRYLEHNS